jgi:hypothetical protein
MSLTLVFKHIADALWAVGGIGAAADLGLEDCGPARNTPCPIPVSAGNIPLEGEPCRSSCPTCCSRPLSR